MLKYGIGLGIFESDHCDSEIDAGLLRNFFVVCNDICKKLVIDNKLVTALLKSNTENVLLLNRSRDIILIDFDYTVIALFLCGKDFKSFRLCRYPP